MSIRSNPTNVKQNLDDSPKSYDSGNDPSVFFPAEEDEQPVRASALLSEQTVSVTLERRFNLGDYESLNVSYTLGGRIPDDVDPMWALDDMHAEVSERITAGVGPEISQREAIAKESFLSTPRNQQQRIIQLHLKELGIDVDALRELLQMNVNLRDVVSERKAVQNMNGHRNGTKVHA
jgi:hypothetical protein